MWVFGKFYVSLQKNHKDKQIPCKDEIDSTIPIQPMSLCENLPTAHHGNMDKLAYTTHFPSAYWLVAILAIIGGCICLRNKDAQSVLLHFMIFFMGIFLSSHQAEQEQKEYMTYSYEELSTLDKTRINLGHIRENLSQKYLVHHIENQEYAIITAMTLGEKETLDHHTKEVFASSGASHVLAISGLHIGILFQIFILVLGGSKKHILFTTPLTLTCIWLYVLLIGLPASATRAALMASIFCFTLITKRDTPPMNSLALTAIIMLFINPNYLSDLSFQLSFLAVLAILLLFKPIYNCLPQCLSTLRIARWAWAMLSVSIAAQIGTAPLIAYTFGTVSCYSVLSSFIAIPATTLILYLCLVFFALAVLPHTLFLQDTVASWLTHLTSLTQQTLAFVGNLPGAYLTDIKINTPQLCLTYMAIVTGCLLIQRLHRYHLHRIRLDSADYKDYTLQEYQM